MQDNRRRWQRLPISIPMFVRWAEHGKREVIEFSAALNISAGGALLAMTRPPKVGAKVSLRIPLPLNLEDRSTSIHTLKAEVVRSVFDKELHLVAARFESSLLLPEDDTTQSS